MWVDIDIPKILNQIESINILELTDTIRDKIKESDNPKK